MISGPQSCIAVAQLCGHLAIAIIAGQIDFFVQRNDTAVMRGTMQA